MTGPDLAMIFALLLSIGVIVIQWTEIRSAQRIADLFKHQAEAERRTRLKAEFDLGQLRDSKRKPVRLDPVQLRAKLGLEMGKVLNEVLRDG